MATTQMNTRIDSALKSAGDLAMRECGFTPSDVVRKVWSFAARNRHRPEVVHKFLDALDDSGSHVRERDAPKGLDAHEVMRGPQIIEQFYSELGIDSSRLQPVAFAQMKGAAYDDEFSERGLL